MRDFSWSYLHCGCHFFFGHVLKDLVDLFSNVEICSQSPQIGTELVVKFETHATGSGRRCNVINERREILCLHGSTLELLRNEVEVETEVLEHVMEVSGTFCNRRSQKLEVCSGESFRHFTCLLEGGILEIGVEFEFVHDSVIPRSGLTLCSSTVGIHQAIRIDPQEAGLLTGIQDHLDLDRITDAAGIDLHHLGFIGTVELCAEEEFLTDPDVSVFHDSVIPHRLETLHSVAISPVKEAKHHKRTDEEKDSSCHVHTSIKS